MTILEPDSTYGEPTCRRFPRSLSDAFSDSRAPSIELPPERRITTLGHRVGYVVCFVGLLVAIVLLWKGK